MESSGESRVLTDGLGPPSLSRKNPAITENNVLSRVN